jgi:hypothetical protein
MSDNFKAGIRFTPDIYAKIGYDSQNETGEMSVIGANGETIWESGSGSGSWTTLTEESITTTEQGGFNVGTFSYIFTSEHPETLRVIFDGTPYECELIDAGSYGGLGQQGPDFSVYPFLINATPTSTMIFTESAGTHTIKLEVPSI